MYARAGECLRDVAGVRGAPLVEVPWAGGEIHRMWRVTNPAAIARVTAALADETIFIADGHHRYETALAYRAEHGGRGGSVLAFLSNMEEEGLVVLPTHRLLRVPLRLEPSAFEARLRETFAVEALSTSRGPTASSTSS